MILASNMSCLVQVWSRTPALILALAMVPVPLAAQTSAFTGDDATWSLYGIVASPAGPGGIGHPDYIVSDLGANWDEDRGIGGVGFEFEARDQPGCFGEVGYGWEFQDAHLGLALRQEDSALIEIDAAAQGSAGCTEPLPLSMSVMTGVSNVNCRNSDIWAEIQARYPNEQTEVLYRHPNADPQSLFINTSFFRNRVEEGSSPRLILDDPLPAGFETDHPNLLRLEISGSLIYHNDQRCISQHLIGLLSRKCSKCR